MGVCKTVTHALEDVRVLENEVLLRTRAVGDVSEYMGSLERGCVGRGVDEKTQREYVLPEKRIRGTNPGQSRGSL